MTECCVEKDQQKPLDKFPEENPNPVLSTGIDGVPHYINPAALHLCNALKLEKIEKLLPDVHIEFVKTCLKTKRVVESEHKVGDHVFLWTYLPANIDNMVFIYGNDITRYCPETILKTLKDSLISLYGLTPAEAKLTQQLVDGITLKKAAKQSGIAIATARYQLREVFSKTRTNRQSELIRRILISPAIK